MAVSFRILAGISSGLVALFGSSDFRTASTSPTCNTIGTLRSNNGDGNGNVRSLGRAGPRRVGVPAKIEITNFTSENVEDGHLCLSCLSQRKFFRKPCQSSMTLFSWLILPV